MGVAVFVSLPFTTYTLLAGLQTIPDDVLEAARIDGAGRFASYWLVVLPMLRPAIAVATLINIINVFNSLPILRTMTGSIPGYDADTTTTLIFKLIQTERQIDTASALSVVNFGLVVVITIDLRADRASDAGGLGMTVTAPAATPVPTGPARTRPRTRRRGARAVLMAAAGAVIALLFLAPYLVMVIGSFKPRAEILRVPPTYLPEQWRPDNYLTLWSTPETPLPLNLISTLVISVCATLLVLVVATPAAYYTARHRFPGRSVFLLVVLATQMLQPTVLAAGLFREFVVLGLNDTWFAMILVNAAFNLSFAVWIMHSFFAGIPLELEEAAALDGATRLQTLRRITLPLVWPGIVTAIIFTFVACWNEFAASLVILSTAANQPLSVALTKFIGQYDSAWQYVFAISVVAIVPVVLLFALIERRLVGGLTAGSIK